MLTLLFFPAGVLVLDLDDSSRTAATASLFLLANIFCGLELSSASDVSCLSLTGVPLKLLLRVDIIQIYKLL